MQRQLEGVQVAVLAADGFEQVEVTVPVKALRKAGADVRIISLRPGRIRGVNFLWRGRNRAIYAGVFLVVASLELYGTAIGTWRWERELPGLGIPDGNPPSGVASGYVWFDVMALLVTPMIYARLRSLSPRDQARTATEGVP